MSRRYDLASAREALPEVLQLAGELGTEREIADACASFALRAGQPALGCELLGYALARAAPPRNRKEAADIAELHAMRARAEEQLGPARTRALLDRGAAADARRVLALAAQLR